MYSNIIAMFVSVLFCDSSICGEPKNIDAFDYDSNCYLWYNTDVSPNLWQYWYDDIAGDEYYGWMECEGEDWYIEVSDTEWEKYDGDTSQLWHIENSFD